MALTEENKASGRPRDHFVVLEVGDLEADGREVWFTPDQAREWVASQPPDEHGLNAGLLQYAAEVERRREEDE